MLLLRRLPLIEWMKRKRSLIDSKIYYKMQLAFEAVTHVTINDKILRERNL
jgi:hypothetical protein